MAEVNDLLDTGVENTNQLAGAFKSCGSMDEFLHAHLHVGMHATTVTDPNSFLSFSFDVDRLVVEFEHLTALQGGLHYLLFPRLPHYSFLKKHEDLIQYSHDGIAALRHTVGHTIVYVDGDFHLLLTAVPKDRQRPDTRLLLHRDLYSLMATELHNKVIDSFKELICGLPSKDLCQLTIRKLSVVDNSRFHILRRDAMFMSLINKAVDKADECHFMKLVILLNQFGQKDVKPLELTDILDPGEVRSVSVHFACNIVAKDPWTHLLFSRYELQELVGLKGALFTTLGMHEATNFQTNLDNTGLDVSDELLDVLAEHGKLTFLQLYADSPHTHLNTPFKHPVSEAIVTCGLSHPKYHTYGKSWQLPLAYEGPHTLDGGATRLQDRAGYSL